MAIHGNNVSTMNRDEEAIGMFQLAVEGCLRSVNEERTLTSDQKQQDDWEVFFVHGRNMFALRSFQRLATDPTEMQKNVR